MIELDRTLESLNRVVNDCYEKLYPEMPRFPRFSFVRMMVTLWKSKVYSKLSVRLIDSFVSLMESERKQTLLMRQAKQQQQQKSHLNEMRTEEVKRMMSCDTDVTELSASTGDLTSECRVCAVASRFAQAVADLSINELKVHFLGSTKFEPDEPYRSLHSAVIEHTR